MSLNYIWVPITKTKGMGMEFSKQTNISYLGVLQMGSSV